MQRYANHDGNSGVTDFEIGDDSIVIRFADGSTYLYGTSAPGPIHVRKMKALAKRGRGLASYINTHVRKNFERRLV